MSLALPDVSVQLQLTAEVEELGLRAEDKRVPTPVVANPVLRE